jgi:hypothetical protein
VNGVGAGLAFTETPQEDLEANPATHVGKPMLIDIKLVNEMTRNMSVALYIVALIAGQYRHCLDVCSVLFEVYAEPLS